MKEINDAQESEGCRNSFSQQNIHNICTSAGFSASVLQQMNEDGIDVNELPIRISEYSFMCGRMFFCGLGMKNDKGGIEFYSRSYSERSVTLKDPSHTTIFHVSKNKRTKECILIFSFDDYLAYEILVRKNILPLPKYCDIIVVGQARNFIDAMLDSEMYQMTHLIFPDTDAGQCCKMTIERRNPNNIKDLSPLFPEDGSLIGFLRTTKQIEESKQCLKHVSDAQHA